VVTGDPVGFRQLFTNLIENAVRHGGRRDLMVVVEGRECLDGGVELSVSDNGQGIPAEHRERVFGVFERLEGPSTGAGTEQAMERLARARFEPGGPPQLVLLDLRMPRMGGLEVLARIRAGEATQRLPVVVLTSSERPEDREEALRQGATWFVCKPTEGHRFRAEVQQLGERWAGLPS